MRILHVIPQFPYFGGKTVIGGHASCLFTLAVAQSASGDQCTILSYTEGMTQPAEIHPGIQLHSLFQKANPGSFRFGLRFLARVYRWANANQEDFDVVHCHSGFADYYLVSALLSRKLKRPVVHTMYCPIPDSGRWRYPGVHATLCWAARHCACLSAMSQNAANSLSDFSLKNVVAIRPAVDVNRFCPASELDIRRELGLAPQHVAIVFVGNAKPQKNLMRVIDAFAAVRKAHPQARLVVTTELEQSSSSEHLNLIQQRIDELGLADDVISIKIVKDMPGLLRACDVLVAPFLDSYGPSDYFMAALEAMATGLPVVVSNVGGMPEVVNSECGRLVNPRDTNEITSALVELVGDQTLRTRLGTAARAQADSLFSPSLSVQRYHEVYSEPVQ